jgi:hypothetical protein
MMYILRPDNNHLQRLMVDIGNLPRDKVWTVTIKEGEPKRSLQQNSYLHALLTILMDYMGEPKTETNTRRFKRRLADSADIMEEYDPKDGPPVEVPKATSDMNVKEMNTMIEAIQMALASMGLTYPSKEDHFEMTGVKA